MVLPSRFRGELIKLAHGSHLGCHLGSNKMTNKILRTYFWKGLNQDVQSYCRSCEECQCRTRGRLHCTHCLWSGYCFRKLPWTSLDRCHCGERTLGGSVWSICENGPPRLLQLHVCLDAVSHAGAASQDYQVIPCRMGCLNAFMQH